MPTVYIKSFKLELLTNHVQPNTGSYQGWNRIRHITIWLTIVIPLNQYANLDQFHFCCMNWSDHTEPLFQRCSSLGWPCQKTLLQPDNKDTYVHLVYALHGLAIMFHLAHIVKVHIDSLGACFLQCLLNGWDGLVVVGCIKAKLFQVCNFRVTASKSCDHYKWNKYTLLQCTIHAYWHIYTVCYRQPHRQHGSLWSSPTGQQWIQQHQLLHWQQGSALPWAPGVQTDQSMPLLCGNEQL